jgi:intein/homing endonuclease
MNDYDHMSQIDKEHYLNHTIGNEISSLRMEVDSLRRELDELKLKDIYKTLKPKEEGMTKMTVNEAMVLAKAIRGRYAELSSLRSSCANRETYFDPKKVIEPTYDIKALDKRCVELENFLLQVDTAIKQSNAITTIEVDADVKSLLTPIC